MKRTWISNLLTALATIGLSGCYQGLETVKPDYRQTDTLRTRYTLPPSSAKNCTAALSSDASAIVLAYFPECAVESRDVYERTLTITHQPSEDDRLHAWITMAIGVLGIGLMIASPYISEDKSTNEKDPSDKEDNQTSNTSMSVFGGGVLLTAIGAYGGFELYQTYKTYDPIELRTPYYGPLTVQTEICDETAIPMADMPVTLSLQKNDASEKSVQMTASTEGRIELQAIRDALSLDPENQSELQIETTSGAQCRIVIPALASDMRAPSIDETSEVKSNSTK